MLTVQDAARILGLKSRTVCARIHQGKLGAEWDGRWLISEAELERYRAARQRRRGATVATPTPAGCPDW